MFQLLGILPHRKSPDRSPNSFALAQPRGVPHTSRTEGFCGFARISRWLSNHTGILRHTLTVRVYVYVYTYIYTCIYRYAC